MKEIGRHQGRCLALQLLYQSEFNALSHENLFLQLQEEFPQLQRDSFTWLLIIGVLDRSKELDTIIEKKSKNWKFSRLSFVDRNILRLALYEMLYIEDVPESVTINEAVELAKDFGGEKSSVFINGILGSLVRGEDDGL